MDGALGLVHTFRQRALVLLGVLDHATAHSIVVIDVEVLRVVEPLLQLLHEQDVGQVFAAAHDIVRPRSLLAELPAPGELLVDAMRLLCLERRPARAARGRRTAAMHEDKKGARGDVDEGRQAKGADQVLDWSQLGLLDREDVQWRAVGDVEDVDEKEAAKQQEVAVAVDDLDDGGAQRDEIAAQRLERA